MFLHVYIQLPTSSALLRPDPGDMTLVHELLHNHIKYQTSCRTVTVVYLLRSSVIKHCYTPYIAYCSLMRLSLRHRVLLNLRNHWIAEAALRFLFNLIYSLISSVVDFFTMLPFFIWFYRIFPKKKSFWKTWCSTYFIFQ